jgi:ABC-type amino acid transport substrate-binding protein
VRKLLRVLATVVAAPALAGCGGGDGGGGGGGSSPGSAGDGAQAPKLQTGGQLTAGAEFPVAGLVELPLDKPKGFAVDLGAAIVQEMEIPKVKCVNGGAYIKDTIKPSKQPRDYTTLGAATKALANGQIDAFPMDVAIGSKIVQQLPDDVAMPASSRPASATASSSRRAIRSARRSP